MSDPFDPVDESSLQSITFLSSSTNRVEIMNALREEGPLTRRELREAVDASRSTVRRTLEGFLEREWVASTAPGYEVTAAGELVAADFRRLTATVERAEEFAPLLRLIPHATLDIDAAWLDDATLTVATETDPYAPAQRQTETVRSADSVDALLPSIELEGTNLVHDRILSGDLTASVVLGPDGVETVQSEPFAELFREMLATGRFEVYACPESVPFYLGLPDDSVEIGAENDEGIPRALVQSTDERLRAWAEETFEAYVSGADRLTEADFRA